MAISCDYYHIKFYCTHTQVTYSIEGFLDKNKDLLFKDLSQAMYACERPLLKELFPEGIMAAESSFT